MPRTSQQITRVQLVLAGAACVLAFVPVLPVPLAELAIAALAATVVVPGLPRRLAPSPGREPAALLLCLVLSGAAGRSLSLRLGLDALHIIALLLIGLPLLGMVSRPGLGRVLAAACGTSVLWALGQRFLAVSPAAIGAGFGSRAAYGGVVGACAPFALSLLNERCRNHEICSRALPPAAVMILIATIMHMGGLLVAVLTVALWSAIGLRSAGRTRTLVSCSLLLIVGAIAFAPLAPCRGHRAALVQSVSTHTAAGYARRWLLEARAAGPAILEHPWLGHGPGTYQRVVSSARYRAALPPTTENVVEPDTQCGYLVLAVEYGAVAAVLFLWTVATAAWRAYTLGDARASGIDWQRTAGIVLIGLGVGMLFTPVLARGTGVILIAALAVAGERRSQPATAAGWWQHPVLRRVAAAVAAGAAVMIVTLPSRLAPAVAEEPPPPQYPSAATVFIEGEDAADLAFPFRVAEMPDASNGRAVVIGDAAKEQLLASSGLAYRFETTAAAGIRVWVRARWAHGCANSVAVALDDGSPSLVGNDGTYRVWDWHPGPTAQLAPGRHTVRLLPRESGAAIDQFALAPLHVDLTAVTPEPAGAPRIVTDELPSLAPVDAGAPPFLAAAGGVFQPGAEALLLQLGIPCVRLRDAQLCDPEALARYDLIWVSRPGSRIESALKAVHDYVTGGGTAILECLEGDEGGHYRHTAAERELVPNGRLTSALVSQRHRPLSVRGADSPYFVDLDGDTAIYDDLSVARLEPLSTDDGENHGRILIRNHTIGVALTKRQVGKGTVYALALPLGFSSMWRGTRFDPVARRLLHDAVGDRFVPLFRTTEWAPMPPRGPHFDDDFMRDAGDIGPWKLLSGEARLTGGPPPAPPQFSHARRPPGPPHPFTMTLTNISQVQAGQADWDHLRVQAAVNAAEGHGGLWLRTTAGRTLRLGLDRGASRLALQAVANGQVRLIAATDVPGPHGGWRRLSLFKRDGAWQAWVDGYPLIRTPVDTEDTAGHFGLWTAAGTVRFDDVRVRAAPELLPGTDTCLGEEGSCRSTYPFSEGIEPRGIYSSTWHLRAHSHHPRCVTSVLPVYTEAILRVDGTAVGRVPPSPAGTAIPLADDYVPLRELELLAPTWRDYHFSGQLVDWYTAAGDWNRQSRWACDQQWEWLGVRQARGRAVLWYRHALEPPYALSVLCAQMMRSRHGFNEADRDINLVLAGNGTDLTDGLLLKTGPEKRHGCEVSWAGEDVSRNPDAGLPAGGGYALHHRWIWLRAELGERRLRVALEGHVVIDCELPREVPRGFVGLWTENNSMQVARATLSVHPANGGGD